MSAMEHLPEFGTPVDNGLLRYFDKVPSKFSSYDQEQFIRGGFRVVPPATARRATVSPRPGATACGRPSRGSP